MIFDAFRFLIQADTQPAKKGIDDVKKSTDDLSDSVKKSGEQADKTSDKFAEFSRDILQFLGISLSIGAAVSAVLGRAQNVSNMANLADSIGIAVGEVDVLRRSFIALGFEGEKARDLLEQATEALGNGLNDVEGQEAKTFDALKISLKDASGRAINTSEAILKIAGAIEGMDKAKARANIMQLGITSPESIEFILRGRKELENLTRKQRENNYITKESAERTIAFNTGLNNLKLSIGGVAAGFFDSIVPALQKVIEWVSELIDYFQDHKDLVVGFFIAISTVIAAVYLPAMIKAGLATLAATWPIIAIGAAIVALSAIFALVYEDIMAFIEGNESLIGHIFEKYPMVAKMAKSVADAFKAMGQTISDVWESLKVGFQSLIDFVSVGIEKIANGLKTVGNVFTLRSESIERNINQAENANSTLSNNTGMSLGAAKEGLKMVSSQPINNTNSNMINNNGKSINRETNVAVGQVTIQTQATDAKGIASSMSGELQGQLKNLTFENSSGIAR